MEDVVDIYGTYSEEQVAKVLVRGNATTCVWCGKAMLVSEADEHGRCEFDAEFTFDDDGKEAAATARGEIAELMVFMGILP